MFEINRGAMVLFGVEIRWYGLLIMLGVLGAYLLAKRRERGLGLKKDTALDLVLLLVPLGVVCARAYYVLFSWDYYRTRPLEILDLRGGGLAVYGAVLGGALAALIYARAKKVPFGAIADLVAPSLAFGQAVGRWGNFFNQEAYGALVEDPALRFFPVATYIEGSGWHYATFFYESAWCALICALLLVWEKKRRFQKRGDMFLVYAFLYALERFVVEGLRTDSLYLGSLRVSQLLSLLVLVGIAVLLRLRRRGERRAYLLVGCVLMLGLRAELELFTILWALLTLAAGALIYLSPADKPIAKSDKNSTNTEENADKSNKKERQ